jgi:enterochelin esterase family protein
MESLKPLALVALLVLPAISRGADRPGYQEVSKALAVKSPHLLSLFEAAVGEEAFRKGQGVVTEGGSFLFALQSATAPQLIIDENAPVRMTESSPNLWTHSATLATSRTHNFSYRVDGNPFGGRNDVPAFGPYSYEKPGVPRGTLSEKMVHTSKIYPGMKSDWWIWAPAQYDPATPAAVMIWQDGEVLVNRELPSRAQIVFENLTHERKIPVIIHVLISPGFIGERRMRSVEYDTVDDTYPKFLRDEILPLVAAKYNIRKDGYSRALAGDSSGGICAFNGAWHMPGEFSRVLSRIGSFTSIQWRPGQLEGGNVYPFKIRKEPKRNIRVWLQEGSGDLENDHGSWPLQNIAMANSLKMRGFDYHFSWGNGTHSRNGGHAELAEEMIWLWRDYDPAKTGQAYEPDPAEAAKPMWRVTGLSR